MKNTIWKYELKKNNQEIAIPDNSKILTIQNQDNKPCVWIEIEQGNKKIQLKRFEKINLKIESYQIIDLLENAEILVAGVEKKWKVFFLTFVLKLISEYKFLWLSRNLSNSFKRKVKLYPIIIYGKVFSS